MSEWKRSTCEVSWEQLPLEMKAEIQKHIELYNLGDILSEALMYIQTDSEKAKRGLFGSAESIRQYVVITPRWLVWAFIGTKTPTPAALSAFLPDVVIQDYADTKFATMIPDSGIEVRGKLTDVSENASAFIGLEDNLVGKKFKETVIHAVQNAKK